jgi:hypothetical protein
MNQNDKPALIFDKKYHTDAGEVYIFPFGYTMDEVSELLHNQATSKKSRLKLKDLMDNLDDSWFPYKGIEKLDFNKKWDVLFGMASGFNPDDIIWYSIEDKKASHRLSEKLRNEIEDFSPQVESSMNWVISPKTWKRIKPELIEYKKQYGFDTDEYYAQWYKDLLSRPLFTKLKFSDKQVAEILNIDLKRFQKIKNMKYADGGELQDSDLRDIVLKSFKDEEGFDFGFESGRSYRYSYKSEDYTAKKSVNYNGEDYTVEFRVKVMYEAEGAATIEELTVDGIDVDLDVFSKEDKKEVQTFFDDMSDNIGQGYAKGGKIQKRPRFDNLNSEYAYGGRNYNLYVLDETPPRRWLLLARGTKDDLIKIAKKRIAEGQKNVKIGISLQDSDYIADGGELAKGGEVSNPYEEFLLANGFEKSFEVKKDGYVEYRKGRWYCWINKKTKEIEVGKYDFDYSSEDIKKYGGIREDEQPFYHTDKYTNSFTKFKKFLDNYYILDDMAKGGKIQKRPRFDNLMADGGVTYVAPNDYDQKYFRRFDNAIGSFAWIYNKKYNEGILYPLTDFDKDYYSHIKLKDGEVLLRYKTDRMMSKYLIKFNLEKSLIYFLAEGGDDDKNPTFESKGIKADYIVLTNNYK